MEIVVIHLTTILFLPKISKMSRFNLFFSLLLTLFVQHTIVAQQSGQFGAPLFAQENGKH